MNTSNYLTPSGFSEGTYYWRVRAIDFADNVGSWSDICYFKVDTNPPIIHAVTFEPTLMADEEIMIYCDVTDIGEIQYVKATYKAEGEVDWLVDYATLFMGNIYNFSLGPFGMPFIVKFYLTAVDTLGYESNSTMYQVQLVLPVTSANHPIGISSVLVFLLSSMMILLIKKKQNRKKL